jgi:hypothetical protein
MRAALAAHSPARAHIPRHDDRRNICVGTVLVQRGRGAAANEGVQRSPLSFLLMGFVCNLCELL